MNKEFIMRGQTDTGQTEVLNFSGNTPGYAYRLVEFLLWPSSSIGTTYNELVATITAGKTAIAPTDPNFNDEGLIAVAQYRDSSNDAYQNTPSSSVINDLFLITQDLILMVQDTSSTSAPINWQCRFVAEKMNSNEEAVTNFKQYTISND